MKRTFPRATQMAFINRRISRAGRCLLGIAGAAALLSGVSAAVTFAAGSAVAEAAGCGSPMSTQPLVAGGTPESTQTLVVSSLNDAGPGSLRAAILLANASPAG